jgi:hypothetical protein
VGDVVIGRNGGLTSDLYVSGGLGVGNATTADNNLQVKGRIYIDSFTESGTEALCKVNNSTTGSVINDCSGAPVLDYAEFYPTGDEVSYGDIVVASDELVNQKVVTDGESAISDSKTILSARLQKSTTPYDTRVIGVVSNNYNDFSSIGYGVINDEDHPMPVALNGRVPVKVSTENGPIAVGDRITSSHLAGVGMKATEEGASVGIALAPFDGSTSTTTAITEIIDSETGVVEQREVKTGQVIVFINIGWNHLDSRLVKSATSSEPWLVDPATGQLTTSLALNLGGQSIENVKSIVSASGNWSISENGDLIVKSITTDNLEVKGTGVTIHDTSNNEPYCVQVINGTLTTTPGNCAPTSSLKSANGIVGAPTPPEADVGVDNAVAPTPETTPPEPTLPTPSSEISNGGVGTPTPDATVGASEPPPIDTGVDSGITAEPVPTPIDEPPQA